MTDTLERRVNEYLAAVDDYRKATVSEGIAFLRAKTDDRCTDGRATQMALVETNAESIIAAAKVEIAKINLHRAANGIVEDPRLVN